jgi:hypothetical protein
MQKAFPIPFFDIYVVVFLVIKAHDKKIYSKMIS